MLRLIFTLGFVDLVAVACLWAQPPINAICISPDGQHLVLGTEQGARVARTEDPDQQEQLADQIRESIHCIEFSPDGKWLALGGGMPGQWGRLIVLQWSDRTVVQQSLKHDDTVVGITWSADSQSIATASLDRSMMVIQLHDSNPIRVIRGHSKGVRDISFFSNQLVSASQDSTIRVWNMQDGSLVRTMKQHTAPVLGLGVASGTPRAWMFSISLDRTVRFWQPSIGRLVRFTRISNEQALDACWTPSGQSVVVCGSKGSVIEIDRDLLTDKALAHFDDRLTAIGIHPNGNTIYVGGFSGGIHRVNR